MNFNLFTFFTIKNVEKYKIAIIFKDFWIFKNSCLIIFITFLSHKTEIRGIEFFYEITPHVRTQTILSFLSMVIMCRVCLDSNLYCECCWHFMDIILSTHFFFSSLYQSRAHESELFKFIRFFYRHMLALSFVFYCSFVYRWYERESKKLFFFFRSTQNAILKIFVK